MEIVFKFFKFGVVGFSGLLIDFSITFLLKEKAGVHKYLANSIGFLLAAGNNYLWNKLWTFQDVSNGMGLQFGRFLIISLAGLLINNLIIYFFSQKIGWNFYLSKVVAVAIVILWNFTMNYLYTFSS